MNLNKGGNEDVKNNFKGIGCVGTLCAVSVSINRTTCYAWYCAAHRWDCPFDILPVLTGGNHYWTLFQEN